MRLQMLRKVAVLWLIFVSLVLASASVVQAQPEGESCDADGVEVGFQSTVCGSGNFFVSLNGVTATGTNTKCLLIIGGNFTFTSSNKAYVKLKPDQKYIMESRFGICVNLINFDVPKGYTLEVDGVETKSVTKTNGGVIFSGDGTWEVVLRKKCPCGNEEAGSAGPSVSSVVWQAGMGKLSDGRFAGHMSVREKILSSTVYTPSALVYLPPLNTTEVDVVKNGSTLRQIKAPQALADIVVINSNEYDIRYYRPADVGAKTGGVYTVSGQPYVTWKFKNPTPGTFTKLEILKYENGSPTPGDKSEYLWDSFVDSWTLSTGWSPTTGYSRVETILISYPNQHSRTETFIVKEGDGTVVSVTAKTYQTFPWGEELVQEVQDPDDAALTTTYAYYDNPLENNRYQKVSSVRFPDGSWEKYDYDAFLNLSTIMRPWKDLSMESATPENSHLTLYGYTNSENGVFGMQPFPRIEWDTEVRIAGVVVQKTRLNHSIPSSDPEPLIETAAASYKSAEFGEPIDFITQTVTTRYDRLATPFLANRLASIVYADGRKETFGYEKGNYVPNADPALAQFIPDANGLAQRQTITHGTTAQPDGIAFKTTKDTSVLDQFGNEVLRETYVYNGSTYERIGWAVNTYDDRSHLLATRDHKGQLTTTTWTGDKKTSRIDSTGIETTYTYDQLGRIKTQTRKGIAAGGGFPAQTDITTEFWYDATGQQTTETMSGTGGLSLTISRQYDKAGRLKRETDQAGISTTRTYTNGGRTVTITHPGGVTQVGDNYLDGQPKSITGSGVVAHYFDYGVNADGTKYAQEFIGNAGLSSPRWTRTTSDWIGRTASVEKPSFTGTNVIETSIYNSLNQLQKVTAMAGSTKLIADKLYEYDQLGSEARVGSDLDANGSLSLASTDRISETDTVYEKVGADWFKVTTDKIYLTDNSSTPVVQSRRERLNNFVLNGTDQTVSETISTNIAGSNTVASVTIDRTAKKQITIFDTPNSNANAISISINGLLQSSAPFTPQSAVTYTYDSLGRTTSVTDPRTGTSTSTYSASSGELASTNDGAGSTTFEYYPPTHASAGRLKSQTNAGGKKTYFNYNIRGQLVQIWGDATYPVENLYDSYGQQVELHTFRNGQNWAASVWPSATTGAADVTKWIYHEPTGLVTQKQDAVLKGPGYTYDELGRVKTRVWARGITTTYGYDSGTGELKTIAYSDSTPGIAISYDRGGRQTNITDASGSRGRTFTVAGQLQAEQVTGGVLDGVAITVGYDSFLRRNSLQTSHGANTLSSQTYGYDSSSRLQTVTSGSQSTTYAYYPNTGLLNTTTFSGGTAIARSYDSIGRLENITTTPASDVAQSYTYTYNNLHQRTRVTREDSSYWSYIYNDRGEVISGKKHWSDDSIVWGAQTEYKFDNLGNRIHARNGGNQLGALRHSNYTTNSRNQYTERTVPGAVDVSGTANVAATVTVNNQPTVRRNDYFYKELSVNNSSGPAFEQLNIVGARNNFGAGGEDAVTEKGGQLFLPASNESFGYDDDGNLISDGRWNYTWDAENRLIRMEAIGSVPTPAKRKLEFSYDSFARRISKKVYAWNISSSSYELQSTTRFVSDGWNLTAELDASNSLIRSYVWGQDFNGALHGAAGIEGLLFIQQQDTLIAGYDGNGNVTTLVNTSSNQLAAQYEYDPSGSLLKAVGSSASSNRFRFSTKYEDEETGLLLYGYRYYTPALGRWLSRDPSEEAGGLNLHAFSGNDLVNGVDYLGLWKIGTAWQGGWTNYTGTAIADCDETLKRLAYLITGHESDWVVLGIPDNVMPGQVVNIDPLLDKFEQRLRDSVLKAIGKFNPIGFGTETQDQQTITSRGPTYDINRYFNPRRKYGRPECEAAALLVMWKGMVDFLKPGELDALELRSFGPDVTFAPRAATPAQMFRADMGYLVNHSDYPDLFPNGAWRGENVIKVGTDQYWGYPLGALTEVNWKNQLGRAYNQEAQGRRLPTRPIENVPGFNNESQFFNVPSIATKVFEHRNK